MAKQHIPFSIMKHITEFEERHRVNLGEGYKNDRSCAHFFSIQMDGSTDAANPEEVIFLAVCFDSHGSEGTVHIRNKFFYVLGNQNLWMQQVCTIALIRPFLMLNWIQCHLASS